MKIKVAFISYNVEINSQFMLADKKTKDYTESNRLIDDICRKYRKKLINQSISKLKLPMYKKQEIIEVRDNKDFLNGIVLFLERNYNCESPYIDDYFNKHRFYGLDKSYYLLFLIDINGKKYLYPSFINYDLVGMSSVHFLHYKYSKKNIYLISNHDRSSDYYNFINKDTIRGYYFMSRFYTFIKNFYLIKKIDFLKKGIIKEEEYDTNNYDYNEIIEYYPVHVIKNTVKEIIKHDKLYSSKIIKLNDFPNLLYNKKGQLMKNKKTLHKYNYKDPILSIYNCNGLPFFEHELKKDESKYLKFKPFIFNNMIYNMLLEGYKITGKEKIIKIIHVLLCKYNDINTNVRTQIIFKIFKYY